MAATMAGVAMAAAKVTELEREVGATAAMVMVMVGC